jgi:hypothetical protein
MHSAHTRNSNAFALAGRTSGHDPRLRIPVMDVAGIEAVIPCLQVRWFDTRRRRNLYVWARRATPLAQAAVESQGLQFCPLRQENLLNSCCT